VTDVGNLSVAANHLLALRDVVSISVFVTTSRAIGVAKLYQLTPYCQVQSKTSATDACVHFTPCWLQPDVVKQVLKSNSTLTLSHAIV